MGATSNTSSLLSPSTSSHHRSHHRHSATGGRFGLSSVKRACATNLKNGKQSVAMATQVLSPRALSQHGSLSRRRFVRHFGAGADDEERFMKSKRRVLCEKLFCYGVSITVVILIMTGVVLAVGYLQTEKQKVLSRSVKLAQEQKVRTTVNSVVVTTTEEPPSLVLPKTTELPPTATTPMANLSQDDTTEDDMEELQILEPPANILKEIVEASNHRKERKEKMMIVDEDDAESNHRQPSEVKVLPPKDFTFDGFSFEFPILKADKPTETSLNFSIDPIEHEESVLAEAVGKSSIDANMDNNGISQSGFNFSLNNQNFSLGNMTKDFGTLSNSDENGIVDLPVVAKLQTDLFGDDDFDSDDNESSASTKNHGRNHPQIPVPLEHDNSYTPRPSSVVFYPEKASRRLSKAFNDRSSSNRNSPSGREKSKSHSYNHNSDGNLNNHNTLSSPNAETTTTSNIVEISTEPPQPKHNRYILHTTTTPAPASIANFKFDFTTPSPTTSSVSDFKFDFTTPSPTTGVSDFKFDLSSFRADTAPQKTDLKFNLPTTTNDYIDYTHLLTTPATTGATTISSSALQDSQFSKRTFNNYGDYDSAGSSSDVNPYAHFLKPFNPTAVIGSPSASGAAASAVLNNYYQQPSYNFDSYDSPRLNIPSGTIPLDLAASYIQAGNPPKLPPQTFDPENYNPTLALSSLIQNGNGGSSGPGENPQYNTITQGIHLLNLLSGNIPQHLITDQHQSGSNNFEQLATKPEYQIAALTGYGGSSGAFLSGLNHNNPSGGGDGGGHQFSYHAAESRSLPVYAADLHSVKTFDTGNQYVADQLPSASTSSFSQNIISKISDFGGSYKGGETLKSSDSPSIQLPPPSSIIQEALANQPKSLSLNIIPERDISSSLLDSFSKGGDSFGGKLHRQGKVTIEESNSRKKDSASGVDSPIVDFLRSDQETAGSEIEIRTNRQKNAKKNYKSFLIDKAVSTESKQPNFGRKLVIKTIKIKNEVSQRDAQERGLKSGFYF